MTDRNSVQRVAVVTGGGSGLGREMAMRFARDGAAVVVADVNADTAVAVAAEITAAGGKAVGLKVDVCNQREVQAMVDTAVEKFGALHILVNSAGVGEQTAFLKQTVEGFERIIAVNLTGTFRCVHTAAPAMIKAGWGRVVNISSVTGLRGVSGRVSYGASKTGVVGMTRAMAIELAPYNITVNAIAPGPVDSAMTRQVHSQETRDTYNRNSALHRYGTAKEIADGAAFLASDQASYITGHTLPIDGGMTMAAAIFDLGA
jgi:NAD(P)-dependent dehydrogenase (short-subunit alcohol dehydrogenase family)